MATGTFNEVRRANVCFCCTSELLRRLVKLENIAFGLNYLGTRRRTLNKSLPT